MKTSQVPPHSMHRLKQAPSTNLLQRLSEADKSALQEIGHIKKLVQDSLIFQAGDPCRNVYLLIKGRAKIYELSPQGKEVIMWFCFSGEMFGLSEVWTGSKRDISAQACSEIEMIVIERARFREFLHSHPNVALDVIDILSGRMRVLGDMMLDLISTDVNARLIKLLARLFQRYGRERDGRIYIDIPITHQEIGDMIGCCRQTVTTALGQLRTKCGLQTKIRTLSMEVASADEAAERLITNGLSTQ